MSRLKKIFGSQSSQETKVYYEKDTQTTKNEDNKTKITESYLEQLSHTQSTQDSWWSSWSGLSQPFSSQKGKKRDLSNDKQEQWWESFSTESTKKDESSQYASSSSQQKVDEPESSSSSQPKEEDTKVNDEKDDAKVSFYLKVGKYKKFKYM